MPFYQVDYPPAYNYELALRHITEQGSEGEDSYPVRPPVMVYDANNKDSQNVLIRATETWPDVRKLRVLKLQYVSTNVSKMAKMQPERFAKAVNVLPTGGTLLERLKRASQTQLIKMASYYLRKDVIGVRWVYRFNPLTGEPCERMDVVYNKSRPLLTKYGESRYAKKQKELVG